MAWHAKESAAERRAAVPLLRQPGSTGRTENCPLALGSACQPKLPAFQTSALTQLPVAKLESGTGRGMPRMTGGRYPQGFTSMATHLVSITCLSNSRAMSLCSTS